MFLYRRGVLILLAFLLIQMGVQFIGDIPDNLDAKLYREDYLYYLEQVEGNYTREKAAWLEAESNAIVAAKQACDKAYLQYYSGAISEQELQTQIQPYEATLAHENGFNVIYDQYLYICEGIENRCFLETNGWAGLFNDQILDFPLILTLLLLVVPVYCSEYVCKMDQLTLTTTNGQKSYLWHKLLIVCLIATILCISQSTLRYGYYAIHYGLPHGDYGIQSIKLFAGSTKTLTLMQAFLLLSVSRLFGALYFSLMTTTISAWTRQYGLTVLLSLASVLIPWIGVPVQIQYCLPLPLPFFLASGLIKGSDVLTDAMAGQSVAFFQEVTGLHFFLLAVGCMVIISVCLWSLWWKHHTALSKSHFHRTTALVSLSLAVLMLSGCSGASVTSENVSYNSRESSNCYTDEFRIYYDDETEMLMMESLKTGEITPLNKDPLLMAKDMQMSRNFFIEEDSVYYTTTVRDNYSERALGDTGQRTVFALRKVDLKSFEEEVIFEWQQQSTLLGINLEMESPLDMLFFNNSFFYRGNNLYIENRTLYEIDLNTKEINALNISSNHNIAFDGRYIYYVNDRHTLSRYDTNTRETIEWSDVAVHDFCLTDNSIYYINLRQQNSLYVMNKDGSDQRLVLNSSLLDVGWDGNQVRLVDINYGESVLR